jgi:hypothetical protein
MFKDKAVGWRLTSAILMVMMVGMIAFGGLMQSASANDDDGFTFEMVPTNAAIKSCLPKASAKVTITPAENGLNDKMTIRVKGLPANTDYDLFVTQVPHAQFGLSWYQTDLHVDEDGKGSVSVRGIFDKETFTISPASLTTKGREDNNQTGATFGAVNMYHLGLWFNDPQVPFKLHCEGTATSPIVTPFNGEQHAGVQVLNTSNFDDNNGPLKHVHR